MRTRRVRRAPEGSGWRADRDRRSYSRRVGAVLGRATVFAALLTVAVAPVAAAAPAARIVDTSQRSILRSGVVRVQVSADRAGVVWLRVRRGRTELGRRNVRFGRRSTKIARVRLTRRGRVAVERCRGAALVATANGPRR